MITHGATRMVILIGKYAIKLPQISYEWRHFLYGLLANMQESKFYKVLHHERMCPVCFAIPGGFMVVMKKAIPITLSQFEMLDFEAFRNVDENWIIPVENKPDSFGILDGKIVAIDYGGFAC